MSQEQNKPRPSKARKNAIDNSASTPPAQPAANVPAGVNPGAPVTTSPGIQLGSTEPTPVPNTIPAEAAGAQGAAPSNGTDLAAAAAPEAIIDVSSPAATEHPANVPAAEPPAAPIVTGQAAPTTPAEPAAPAAPAPAAPVQAAPAPAPAAPKAEETAVAKVNSYIPGGLSKDVVNPIPNPAQTDQNFPFSAGHKMHEVAQYQNFFTFPLDTYYNIFDAIFYFSDEKNRSRYTYDQQQIIISRIVRAAMDFGIPIEGIRDKLTI